MPSAALLASCWPVRSGCKRAEQAAPATAGAATKGRLASCMPGSSRELVHDGAGSLAPLDSDGIREARAGGEPRGLAVDAAHVHWLDCGREAVMRAPLAVFERDRRGR